MSTLDLVRFPSRRLAAVLRSLVGGALALGAAGFAAAGIQLAPLFRDGAVLQRDKPLPVWGRGAPGERVTVSFRAQKADAIADESGAWRVTLQAERASAEPAVLRVAGSGVVEVRDVLVGDVWLCSGQSNMEWKVSQSRDAEKEIAAANFPLIRQFKIPRSVSAEPAFDARGEWNACSPDTVGEFSGVAYFFGRALWQERGVPIGLINSSYGGTVIESWLSEPALKAEPAYPVIRSHWENLLAAHSRKQADHETALAAWTAAAEKAEAAGKPFPARKPPAPEGPGSRWQPASLYNAMIHPLVPYALCGVIWYQGEGNGDRYAGSIGYQEYRSLFPALIAHWRADFHQPELPFYFAQIANCVRKFDPTQQEWAFLREAQERALKLPHTGMVVTIDIGEPDNIHPLNKQEVGRRFGLLAAALQEGRAIESSGPRFAFARPEQGGIRLHFTHAEGLHAGGRALSGFEIAGEARRFMPADARIEGETILVSALSVKTPVAVRYAWHNTPEACLFNAAGLPAAPFRSDDW